MDIAWCLKEDVLYKKTRHTFFQNPCRNTRTTELKTQRPGWICRLSIPP